MTWLCFLLHWSAYHFMQCRALRNHREDGFFLLNAKLKYNSAWSLARPFYGIMYFLMFGHESCRDAMRFCQFHKIGREHIDGGITLLEKELLPLAYHAKILIVHDGDLDVRALLNRGGQFGGGHLESAIAHDGPNLLVLR